MNEIKIDNFTINNQSSTFIIAELSCNHNHDFEIACKTIEYAKKAGADAIKLQTYTPDTITIDCDNEFFQIKQDTLWDGQTLHQLYGKAYTPWEWHSELQKVAEKNNLIFFSSPFDYSAVDFLEKLNVPAYKIASFEITDIPLIEYVAKKNKPIIISTGIAEYEHIVDAVDACRNQNNDQIILLQCTSAYPAPIQEANLLMLKELRKIFNTIVGISDHTIGSLVPVTSIGLGAKVIEKHFILDKSIGGPDVEFSLDFNEFKKMVKDVRTAEKSLGKVDFNLSERVKKNKIFQRSLFIVEDVKKGDMLSKDNIRSIRPGYGMLPKNLNQVLGKKFNRSYSRGTPLKEDMFE